MTQLRSCYFCGAVGDSLQEYDVVPDRLASPHEPRSAVLCSTCHEKLRRVLEPLVDAAEASPSPDGDVDSLEEVTFESDGTSEKEPAHDGEESVTEDTDDRPQRDASDDTGEGEPDAAANADEIGESETGAETDDSDESETDAEPGEDLPDDYYRVLRLLQNREFPMERADLTGVVTGAYDVTASECERILETAIERGVLVEDGSTVDVGRN